MPPRAYLTGDFAVHCSTLIYPVSWFVRTEAPRAKPEPMHRPSDGKIYPLNTIMKLRQNLKIKSAQEHSFSGSILPVTMFLAQALREIIEPELQATTRTLPFDDRVLVWLAPELERDIVLFHGGRGMALKAMFPPDAVAHLDSEYHQILRNRISLHGTA